ncbi:hypothetical protein Q5424_09410 [Conexibacter sp. JD483]|uniref:hypothetical protein n=1 Tax=unclassified Conexibacter TaxID=2627773 RepID=UPI00271684F0|nr:MULTISPECIES: hypothetical protein [unclassified Conexibacter]MDO8187206.1 hypothetical protein [Conexibacter sp. CPCC 205706]MDO8199303.1 hypothetical protein [Conexibacter sp. CPCC 205762]MDR9369296.1 hypothetical protein [Conexibacter sp. JD483]
MAATDWAPSPDYVAALMHTRTRGRDSIAATAARELGRFTANTRPTLTQVQRLIELAAGEVASHFPGRSPCTPDLEIAAGAAVAYRAAQLVEASLAPERTNYLGSAHEAYRTLADDAIRALSAAVIAGCPLDAGGS